MPKIKLDGIDIAYDVVGSGTRSAILTPGGRFSKDTPGIRELAGALAKDDYRVVVWDRPNCGESDVCFDAESESILNADMLAALLKALDTGPALVFGGSAGSRVSLLAALRHPDVVGKLVLNWITGSWTGLAALVGVYCGELVRAARVGGMEAVADSEFLAECVERNPGNRARILALDEDRFCDTMQRWAKSFYPEQDSPVPGLLPAGFAALTMPVLIFRSGRSDFSHPRATSEEVHRLIPGSQLVEPPWGDREWIERMTDAQHGLFRRFPLLAPQILEFDQAS